MRWLYDEQVIALLFRVLIAATPVVALLGYVIHSLVAGGASRNARILWIVFGLAGPANFGLWHLFNAIEDHWGLDRVKPLLINFGIFIALGVVIGLILRSVLRPPEAESPPSPADTKESQDN